MAIKHSSLKHASKKHASKKSARSQKSTKPAAKKRAARQSIKKRAGPQSIEVWGDDPGDDFRVRVSEPDPEGKPLTYRFATPAPPQGKAGTAGFRYWTNVEALRRGADFWAKHIGTSRWQTGAKLQVLLDEGEDLNAYYDRNALNFFHGQGPKGMVYSGESPDVACHEMGHAILDTIKPDLWNTGAQEVAAFHESFGDMSSILCALQLDDMRKTIIAETGGHLYRNSRLSRLAEQLGEAIRARYPDAADPDCLRNAVNSFSYRDPLQLPSRAPASHLSSEPHSFSRVFTGAFFEGLGGMGAAMAGGSGAVDEGQLLSISAQMAEILVNAIRRASVVPNFFAQVAAAMVAWSGQLNAAYPGILKAVFVRRGILSFQTAMQPQSAVMALGVSANVLPAPQEIGIPAEQYGVGESLLLVHAASQQRSFVASAADPMFGELSSHSAETAARAFVDDLFQNGRVRHEQGEQRGAGLVSTRTFKTHSLVKTDRGLMLERICFDCGLCPST